MTNLTWSRDCRSLGDVYRQVSDCTRDGVESLSHDQFLKITILLQLLSLINTHIAHIYLQSLWSCGTSVELYTLLFPQSWLYEEVYLLQPQKTFTSGTRSVIVLKVWNRITSETRALFSDAGKGLTLAQQQHSISGKLMFIFPAKKSFQCSDVCHWGCKHWLTNSLTCVTIKSDDCIHLNKIKTLPVIYLKSSKSNCIAWNKKSN